MAPVITDSNLRNIAWDKLYGQKQQVDPQAAAVGAARLGRYDLLRTISSLPYLKQGMKDNDKEMIATGVGISGKTLEELETGYDLLGAAGSAVQDEEAARQDQFKNLSREGVMSYDSHRFNQDLLGGLMKKSGLEAVGQPTISNHYGGPLDKFLPPQHQPPTGQLQDNLPQYGMTSPKPSGSLFEPNKPGTVPTEEIKPKQQAKKPVTIKKKKGNGKKTYVKPIVPKQKKTPSWFVEPELGKEMSPKELIDTIQVRNSYKSDPPDPNFKLEPETKKDEKKKPIKSLKKFLENKNYPGFGQSIMTNTGR